MLPVAKKLGVAPFSYQLRRARTAGHPWALVGAFPMPDAVDPHPSVEMFFQHFDGLFLWRQDDVKVYFGRDDRVSKWVTAVSQSGV
jgi:hypothetical protein